MIEALLGKVALKWYLGFAIVMIGQAGHYFHNHSNREDVMAPLTGMGLRTMPGTQSPQR